MPTNDPKVPIATLSENVRKWFDSEGYPLEFRTARAFQQGGFSVEQGYYVKDDSDVAKEIDVLADATASFDEHHFLRISHVVECKWSRDKPWVIFTSENSRMAESACIAQSVGSRLGEAVMYCLAGHEVLHKLEIFRRPLRGGFAGRRAFEKVDTNRQDLFYRTIQSVISNTVSKARSWNRNEPKKQGFPASGVVIFPVIVVEGDLFEAFYDAASDETKISETNSVRVLWRGSTAKSTPIAAVDIVSAGVIDDFVRTRAGDLQLLLTAAIEAARRICLAFEHRTFENLDIRSGPLGFIGLPPLMSELYQLCQAAKAPAHLPEQP